MHQLTNQILLRGWEVLRLRNIIVEVLDIPGEVQNRTGRDEAKHFHAAVVADPKAPRPPADIHRTLEASNGVGAVATKPDHQLIVTGRGGVADILRGVEVVRDVSADVLVADAPKGSCRNGGDLGDEPLSEVARGAGIALHVVLAAVLFPGGRLTKRPRS